MESSWQKSFFGGQEPLTDQFVMASYGLTREERDIAARRAWGYPRGYGKVWIPRYKLAGHGDIEMEWELTHLLKRRPGLIVFCSPAAAVAAHRGAVTDNTLWVAYRCLDVFCENRGVNYKEMLDRSPRRLARLLRESL